MEQPDDFSAEKATMTNAQNYTATGMATVRRWTPTVPVDTKCENGVQSKEGSLAHAEFIEFMRIRRCVLLEELRWIERHYPEAVR